MHFICDGFNAFLMTVPINFISEKELGKEGKMGLWNNNFEFIYTTHPLIHTVMQLAEAYSPLVDACSLLADVCSLLVDVYSLLVVNTAYWLMLITYWLMHKAYWLMHKPYWLKHIVFWLMQVCWTSLRESFGFTEIFDCRLKSHDKAARSLMKYISLTYSF